MERKIETKEPRRIFTMDRDESGLAIQFLAASEQFSTKTCARCTGLLVNDWYYDSSQIGKTMSAGLRCVQCGHRVDPVILQNTFQGRLNVTTPAECA